MKQILRRVKTHTKSRQKIFLSLSLSLRAYLQRFFVRLRRTSTRHSRQTESPMKWKSGQHKKEKVSSFRQCNFCSVFLWKLSLFARVHAVFFLLSSGCPANEEISLSLSLSLSLEKRKVELKKWAFRFFVSRRQSITTSPHHHHNYHHRCHDSFQFLVFDVAIVVACIEDDFC